MSEHTKRWNAPRGATIHESAKGEFVLYSDYAAIEAKLVEANSILNECRPLTTPDEVYSLAVCDMRLDKQTEKALRQVIEHAYKAGVDSISNRPYTGWDRLAEVAKKLQSD
jgi:hypothetical protein